MPSGNDPSAPSARGRHRAADPGDEPFAGAPSGPPSPPTGSGAAPFSPPPAPLIAPYQPPPASSPSPIPSPPPSYEPAVYAPPPSYPPPSYPPPSYPPPSDPPLGHPTLDEPYGPPAVEPTFIPLLAPRRGRRVLRTAAVSVLAAAVVLGGGYLLLGRSTTHPAPGAARPSVADFPKTSTPPSSTSPAPLPVATRSGVTYHFSAGHFLARFPSRPVTSSIPGSFGKVHYIVHMAADDADGTLVEETDYGNVPSTAVDGLLDGMANGLRASTQLTERSVTPTTFRQHPARRISLTTRDGTALTALLASYPAGRVYVFLSPSGAPFTALEKSFVALP